MSRTRYTRAHDLHNMVAAPRASTKVQAIYKAENGILICYGTSAIGTLEAEAADTYAPGCIYIRVNGASSVVYINEAAAGSVANFAILYGCDVQSSMTGVLTDLSGVGIVPGTADYEIADLAQGSVYGWKTQDEGETCVKVIQANKVHIAEIRAILVAMGIIAS